MVRGFRATYLVAATVAFAFCATPSGAGATITSAFSRTPTPIPCAIQVDGVRLCDETAFLPPLPRSTVKTFDGVPIDVRVAFPPAPVNAPDGPYPLVMLFHRYAGEKLPLSQMQTWLDRGYATFSMTDRGFGESCGTQAARDAAPADCAGGYVRMIDPRYEVRDAQELAGRLADEGVIYPRRIAATGRSYGGALSVALAVLKDRTMLPDGTLVPWTTPRGVQMRITAAAAQTPWTDLLASLVPNGSTLDYVRDAPYLGRTGILKKDSEGALYGAGLPFFYADAGADPSADLTGWHNLLAAGEPYDDLSGNPLPATAAMREELTAHHSPYYVDHSVQPAPLLIESGFTDDLFPADEAIRLYNRTRSEYPSASISLFLADMGHSRGQNKPADTALGAGRVSAWVEYYLKGVGSLPHKGIEALTQTCPASAPSDGPYFASSLSGIAPGEVRVDDPTTSRILATAGSQSISATFAPLSGGGACATAPAGEQTGIGTSQSEPVPAGGFTLMGSATVVAGFTSRGSNSQIAARLLDVDPATNTETLVARGLWRPAITTSPVQQVFQMHPNGYRFAAGHIVKLELLPNDSPYGRVSNKQQEVKVGSLQLRLPTLEPPGSLGGYVLSPLPKVLRAGDALARDFTPAPYAQPREASSTQVALVPAFQPCTFPNSIHGGPLAFGSCSPPQQSSPNVTIPTTDSNGQPTGFSGSVGLAVVPDDLHTAASEADVSITASLVDVRRSDLADYTGELQARTSLRITDRASGSAGDETATVQDTHLWATIQCVSTPGAAGANCSLATSADALVPGTVKEGNRAIWELGEIDVFDGGPDGLASTPGNALFARQGLFVP